MKRIKQVSLSLFLLLCLLLSACGTAPGSTQTSFSLEDVPAFSEHLFLRQLHRQ